MQIKIKRIENGKLPEYKTEGAAGADCYARISEKVIVKPKTVETIPLGFSVEVPEGYEMQIRGRSGNARKNWVQVFNSPGTIDSDYRGEVGAILYNASDKDFEVNPGDRIAQAIIAPVIKAEWYLTEKLSETDRGEGGFGSTGISEEKKIEKFYEPFKTVAEAEMYLGRKVVIDNKIYARVEAVWYNAKNYIMIEFRDNEEKPHSMYLVNAFERVKIDGHRFGREIKENDDN